MQFGAGGLPAGPRSNLTQLNEHCFITTYAVDPIHVVGNSFINSGFLKCFIRPAKTGDKKKSAKMIKVFDRTPEPLLLRGWKLPKNLLIPSLNSIETLKWFYLWLLSFRSTVTTTKDCKEFYFLGAKQLSFYI